MKTGFFWCKYCDTYIKVENRRFIPHLNPCSNCGHLASPYLVLLFGNFEMRFTPGPGKGYGGDWIDFVVKTENGNVKHRVSTERVAEYLKEWEGVKRHFEEERVDYFVDLPHEIVICQEENNGYWAEIPLLKGCVVWGETECEAREEIAIVKREWIKIALERGWEIPVPEIESE